MFDGVGFVQIFAVTCLLVQHVFFLLLSEKEIRKKFFMSIFSLPY